MPDSAADASREEEMGDKNELVLRIPHSLGAADAQKRIASGIASAKAQYGGFVKTADTEWDGNRMTFCLTALAQTVRGSIDVENNYVELRAQLPMVIRMLAKRFVPIVQDTGQKLLLTTKKP
jgi:hypothetical protein